MSGILACATPEKLSLLEEPSGSAASADPLGTIGTHWLDSTAHSGGALEIIGSGGLAIAVLALMFLVARPLRWLLIPLAALGSMPLTAYTAHLLLFVGGWFPLTEPLVSWAIAAAGLLVLTTAWALLIGRGPLERLTARAGSAFARQGSALGRTTSEQKGDR